MRETLLALCPRTALCQIPFMPRILLPLFSLLVALSANAASPPNVIIIFIDDMGYGDVGFNGATGPKTPNLDQMAAEGMRFDDFYVGCAVCSGSRTALLTGTHYRRLSMSAVLFPRSDSGLHPDEVTIADMLKEAGYNTACVGKWHLGHLPPCLPTYQGFDSYYGIPYSNDMWIDPANRLANNILIREGLTLEEVKAGHKQKNQVPLMRNEEVIEYPADQTTLTKRYTEESIRFIKSNTDHPFFLYLPHTMVHLPLAVSEAFENRTGQLIWDAIEEVDWSVGEILKTLRQEGIAENTLVLFTSDNGAAVGTSAPLRARKGSVYDGGIREPTVMWWPGTIPAGEVCTEVAATIDVLPTLAKLCGGKLPERKIDGKDISSLLKGEEGAKSPHDAYVLMHGPGTVRSGPWKFYPWQEKADDKGAIPGREPSPDKVQLYNVAEDIGETTNVAAEHPEIVARLQAAYDEHVADIQANQRPAMEMTRPENPVASPDLPSRKKGKPLDWTKVKQGDVFPTNEAPDVARSGFVIDCTIKGESPSGVILAHGGTVVGYSLAISHGEAVLAVRTTNNDVARINVPVGNGKSVIQATVAKNGELSLSLNGSDPVRAKGSAIPRHPSEPLSIGHDTLNPVDPESPTGAFTGEILFLKVSPVKD